MGIVVVKSSSCWFHFHATKATYTIHYLSLTPAIVDLELPDGIIFEGSDLTLGGWIQQSMMGRQQVHDLLNRVGLGFR